MRIPTEVAAELDQGAGVLGDWRTMRPHVQIETVQPTPLLGLLKAEVDAGEAAALALGVSLHADLVLMDEMHVDLVSGHAVLLNERGRALRICRGALPEARVQVVSVSRIGVTTLLQSGALHGLSGRSRLTVGGPSPR